MFCPKCGASLPDGARFCGACGAQITLMPKTSTVEGATHISGHQGKKVPPIAVAVVVVAVIGVAVAFATGLLGGPKVPNGTISVNGAMYFQFERQGSDTYVTVGNAQIDGSKSPFVRGRLVRDGRKDDGVVWRLEDVSVPNGGTPWDWYHLQFPEGAADGKLAGVWKFSFGDKETADTSADTRNMLVNFSDDGGAWYLEAMGKVDDLTQRRYTYDDALALSRDASQNGNSVTLEDGLTWWPNGDDYQWGSSDYVRDITFDLS